MAERVRKQSSDQGDVRVNRTVATATTTTADGMQIPVLKVPRPFQGFINFVREQGVVGLGVGFIIGTSANTLIKSVVTNVINPIIGVMTGGIDLSQKTVCIQMAGHVCKNAINYGQVISDSITFLAIVAVVYFVVKSLRLEKLDKKKA